MSQATPALLFCRGIHPDGCGSVIEPSYAFCPGCGRATASVRSSPGAIALSLERGSDSLFLPLEIKGQRSLILQSHFDESSPLRFKAPEGAVDSLDSNLPKPASLGGETHHLPLVWVDTVRPPLGTPLQIPLQITTHDKAPDCGFDLEPANRARVWAPLYLRVSSPRPGRLETETEILLLSGRARERELRLHNSGETALRLRPPILPAGFEMRSASGSGSGEWILAPGARKSWTVHALAGAPTGETLVQILSAAGSTLGEIALLVPAASALLNRTRYVLGVDFGTSGTSIWKRDGRDDRQAATALTDTHFGLGDDPKRFPTVIYIAFENGHERGFYIGYEAIRKQKEAARGAGLFVREIKSLLRAETEPYIAEFGPNYRVDLLLRRYLEKLRTQIIDPELEGGESASVAWNFSLPVLDSHPGGANTQFNLQKSRLERAIRDAGYVGTGDALEFFTEPFCAAVYLLLGHGQYRYPQYAPPQDGDWACVFDSGGGTTDVVLGQLRLDEGQLRFQEVSTLGGYRETGAKAARDRVATFGGEALTRTTAIYLSIWKNEAGKSYDLLRYEIADLRRKGYLRELDETQVVRNLRSIAQLAPGNEDLFQQEQVEIEGNKEDNLWRRFPDLWEKVERYKREMATVGAPGARAELKFPPLVDGDNDHLVSIARHEFDHVVVNRRLEAIGDAMRTQVFGDQSLVPAPAEVKWIFGVGGNCRVRRVQDWLQEFFPGKNGVQQLTVVSAGGVDESDRMLAVAGGAVWANKASRDNTLPYAVRIEDGNGQVVFEAKAHMPLSAIKPREPIYELNLGDEIQFRCYLSGTISGAGRPVTFNGVAGCFWLANRHDNTDSSIDDALNDSVPRRVITLRIGMEGRRLRAWSDEAGEFAELFSLSL